MRLIVFQGRKAVTVAATNARALCNTPAKRKGLKPHKNENRPRGANSLGGVALWQERGEITMPSISQNAVNGNPKKSDNTSTSTTTTAPRWTAPEASNEPKTQTRPAEPTSRQWARYSLQCGLNVLPIKADGSKAPAVIAWEQWKEKLLTGQELNLFTSHTGLGIIGGAISGNLEILDFETEKAFNDFAAFCADHGYGELLNAAYITETPSGGRHVYLRCTEPVKGNQKLAHVLVQCEATDSGAKKFGTQWFKKKTLIETRGEGGYVVGVGSPAECHALKKPYEVFNGSADAIPVIEPHDLEALHSFARALNEYVEPEHTVRPRAAHQSGDGARPGDDFNLRGDILPILQECGYKLKGTTRGGTIHLQRPDKSGRGISATYNYGGSGLLYVFSSNDPFFDSERAYDKFAVYAYLKHGKDFSTAAKALAAEGYGQKAPRVTILKTDAGTSELGADANTGANDKEKKSQADLLLDIAIAESTSFRNDADEFFATFDTNGRRLTYKIGSQAFTSLLKLRYYQQHGRTPSNNGAIQTVTDTLRGMALAAPTREVSTRVAAWQGAVYYDLGDETGRVVEITPLGWELLDKSPVPFVRPKGTLPQVEPRRGGRLDSAAPFFNVKPEDWPLVKAFLLSFFQPSGPRPHWAQIGEQGTGKTSNSNATRAILDPNAAPARKDPKDARDLMIAAKNNALVAFDNLSHLPQWLSDGLCCLSTGAGFATRANYTDDEEAIFSLRRPVIFNGINEVATRPDLLDRTLLLELPLLTESARQQESEREKSLSDAMPMILGALFDAVATGLRNLPSTRPQNLPRMADFAAWIEACAPALGWESGEFLKLYSSNRKDTQNVATELSTLAQVLLSWFGQRAESFTGTPVALFEILTRHATDEQRRARDWPRDAQAMGRELTRLAPSLRSSAVDAKKKKTDGKRLWEIRDSNRDTSGTDKAQTGAAGTLSDPASVPAKSLIQQGETANRDSRDTKSAVFPLSSNTREKEREESEIEERRKEAGKAVPAVPCVPVAVAAVEDVEEF